MLHQHQTYRSRVNSAKTYHRNDTNSSIAPRKGSESDGGYDPVQSGLLDTLRNTWSSRGTAKPRSADLERSLEDATPKTEEGH